MSITIEKVSEIHTQIPSSIYPALPLAANDIRLITIQAKGNDDNPDSLSCSLHVSSLNDSTPYHALSYTWGPATVQEADDRPATSITCNGHAILITHNLADTRQPRAREQKTDDAERSRQVQLMASIYSSAFCVLIWLGEEDDHTAKALRLIHHLTTIDARHLARLTPQSIAQSPLSRERGGGGDDDDILRDPTSWDAVRTPFRRNYFCRSWIIQEVVLARSATVLCGGQTTSWTHLESVSHFFSTTSWSSHFSSTSLLRDTTRAPATTTSPRS
ncbi:heterokaryon incompatibility protein-domain-containing protein [Colletotrichum phormii]|uniref:Heterokaryon incompatibility protein-domain-containing protein n=1 Tax=Colletotrichum phormii TaxID=359342 RepID=A0AAJ0EDI2_9PEZI|nr:heterokaryon incompatibility protein-domain-containing protein [Colletotrichum phormii]KAK1625622.1 heterokaryon incompatibility protein-domain-containing protein [Colletotrichum phormii]